MRGQVARIEQIVAIITFNGNYGTGQGELNVYKIVSLGRIRLILLLPE